MGFLYSSYAYTGSECTIIVRYIEIMGAIDPLNLAQEMHVPTPSNIADGVRV